MTLRCASCGYENQPGPATCQKCGASLKVATVTAPPSTSAAVILFVIAALGMGFLGVVLSAQVSLGPSLVGIAILLAVFARINQAAGHQRQLYEWRRK